MQTVFALGFTATWFFFVYWVVGWFRRRLAEHRARLIEWGWIENNKPRRIRGEKYTRIASIVYIVAGAIAYLSINSMFPFGTPAVAVIFGSWLGSAIIAFFPAALTYAVYAGYTEWVEPQGDIALKLRDGQWHPGAATVVPSGQFGGTKVLDVLKEAVSNPSAVFVRPRRVVDEGAK